MKVSQLRTALERFPDDAEVRILSQPRHPIEHHVVGVCTDVDLTPAANDDDGRLHAPTAALLIEGEFHGYANGWPGR